MRSIIRGTFGLALAAALVIAAPSARGTATSSAQPAAPYTPGVSYFGTNEYIEYIPGNLPVVFAAPHGGGLTPSSIPNRTTALCGSANFATVRDANTEELTREIQAAFFERTGRYPHIVINRLHRTKLDANRLLDVAACGNPEAEQAWHEFHAFINVAKNRIVADHDKGWFTDIHGHGHAIQRLELGYNMNAATLRLTDVELDSDPSYEESTAIKVFSQESPLSFSTLLRGPTSLGAFFENRGYPSVPSLLDPAPNQGDAFFSGGDNTRAHGCLNGGQVCGVQIEHNRIGIRDTAENRASYARTLYEVYDEYLLTNFGMLVRSPAQGIETLSAAVEDLVANGSLSHGTGQSLTAKLRAAARLLDRGPGAAQHLLFAFERHVDALVRSGRLGADDGDRLATLAKRIGQGIRAT